MNVVAQVFAGVAALIHVVVWVWESFLFDRPGIHQGIFRVASEDVPAVKLWSFNQGFYNLFLATGTIIGLVALNTGDESLGRAFVFYTCGFMVFSGIMLGISDRLGLGRLKGTGLSGAFAQAVPPLVAVIAAAL
jgi:putative membrane protein